MKIELKNAEYLYTINLKLQLERTNCYRLPQSILSRIKYSALPPAARVCVNEGGSFFAGAAREQSSRSVSSLLTSPKLRISCRGRDAAPDKAIKEKYHVVLVDYALL